LLRKFKNYLHQKNIGKIKSIIISSGNFSQEIFNNFSTDFSREIVGIVRSKKGVRKHKKLEILGDFSCLEEIIEKNNIDEVIVIDHSMSEDIRHKTIGIVRKLNKKLIIVPDEISYDLTSMNLSLQGNLPVMKYVPTPLDGWKRIVKRLIDIIFSFFGIIFFAPFFLIIAISIKTNDRGSVFYKSIRVGRFGKEFLCWKFRTMIVDAELKKEQLKDKNERVGDVFFKIKNDPRITSIGRILRKWSLDELPQLWNVLRGEMSLIGPRPHLPEEVKSYTEDDRIVFFIRPGITSFSQVSEMATDFENEMRNESYYLNNWSLWLDLVIVWKTIWVVLRGKNY
jgi:exopolysaccharide biosynthesis polyprenyl glycosylphosphotransferase